MPSARDRRKARRSAARQAAAVDPQVAERFGEHNEKRWGENSDPAILADLAQPNAMTAAFVASLKDELGEDTVDAALDAAADAAEALADVAEPDPEPEPDIEPDLDSEPDDDEEPFEPASDDEEGKARHMIPAEMEEEEEEGEKPKPKKPKKKPAKKNYPQPTMMDRPYGGATSWTIFDDFMQARDKSAAVREVMYAFDCMIENIMASPEIQPEDKGQAIGFLAEGFRSRILSLKQQMNIVERVKAALGGARRNDLPDSAFAYIEAGGKKDESGRTVPRSLRHYPVNDKAHVRNALSRAAAAIKKGGTTAAIARRALPKIHSAAKRLGIGKPAGGEKAWSGIALEKGSDGVWRWFGWASNKWRDRDFVHAPEHGGEILVSDAHKDFVAWVDENPKDRMPELWIWHTPGTARKHRADWIDFADGFLVASGPLEETETGQLMALELLYDVGMSHGMHVYGRDKANGYVTKYRTFEMSVLPRERAANPWTSFATILKEVATMGFTQEKRSTLVAALGEEATAALEGQTGNMAKMLTELGIDNKATPDGKPAPKTEPAPAETPAPLAGGEAMAMAKAIVAEMNLDGLSTFLKAVVDRLGKVEQAQTKTTEQKLAEAITPVVSTNIGHIWESRPSASDATKAAPEDEAIAPPSHTPEAEGQHGWVMQELGLRGQQPAA